MRYLTWKLEFCPSILSMLAIHRIAEKHAPSKNETLRDNQTIFINKMFRKEVYRRSLLRNLYIKTPSLENERFYKKKQRNKCVLLWKKCIEEYFQKITKNGIVLKKTFGILSSLFLSNKSSSSQNDIALIANFKVDFEGNALGRTFNHFVKNV